MPETLNVLVLDPAMVNTGVVVFSYDGTDWSPIYFDVIKTKGEAAKKRTCFNGDDKVRRIREIYDGLNKVVEEYKPRLILAELAKGEAQNSSGAAAIVIARCVTISFSRLKDIPMQYCWWDDVKNTMTGRKDASKEDIMDVAYKMYPCFKKEKREKPTKTSKYATRFEHIADAVGVFEFFRTHDFIKMLESTHA